MLRVDCPRCGLKVEQVSGTNGKKHLTITYDWGLANRNLYNLTAIGIDEICWKKDGEVGPPIMQNQGKSQHGSDRS